jgi:hypothetical protein
MDHHDDVADEELRDKFQFALRAMWSALAIFLIAAAIAAWQIIEHVDDIEAERQDRIQNMAGIIDDNCETNNEQDQLLATLVAVSISGNSSFGDGIDRTQLTEFEAQVLAAINKVQSLQGDQRDVLTSVFEKKLADLRDLTDCAEAVSRFIAGDPTPESHVPEHVVKP